MPVCPACKADSPASRFCAQCGAIREDGACGVCGAALAAGSRFCPECGNSVAARSAPGVVPLTRQPGSRLPWIIGGTATAALLTLVIAQSLNTGASTASQPLAPSPAAATPGAAPDISQMSPRERANRLYDRIMRLDEEGKTDSVQLFAAMAIPTFQSIQPFDAHLRYDLGRVAVAAGQLDLAQAQADSILDGNPQHLLGLILAARIAQRRGDQAAAARLRARLAAAEASERAKGLEEYQLHDADIRAALSGARDRR